MSTERMRLVTDDPRYSQAIRNPAHSAELRVHELVSSDIDPALTLGYSRQNPSDDGSRGRAVDVCVRRKTGVDPGEPGRWTARRARPGQRGGPALSARGPCPPGRLGGGAPAKRSG